MAWPILFFGIPSGAAALLLFLLCLTPRGLVDPGTGLLLKLSALLARRGPVPWDAQIRRTKGASDMKTVSRAPRKPLIVEEGRVRGGEGSGLLIRLYRPEEKRSRDAILFFHGGGHVLGSVDSYDPLARGFCAACNCLVASLEYRLAPEHPFPAAIADCLAAYTWMRAEAGRRGFDPGRLFVAGDSAGGNLAAVLCLQARDASLPMPAGQLLFYPVADLSRMDGPSYSRYAEGFILTKEEMEWFRSLYLPDPRDRIDPRASPLLAPDLSRLPPALILTAAYDVLRDEGEALARRLEEAGVPVRLRRMGGTVHGFLCMNRFTPAAAKALRLCATFLNASRRPEAEDQ